MPYTLIIRLNLITTFASIFREQLMLGRCFSGSLLQTPVWVGFAEFRNRLLRSRTNAFASFLEKNNTVVPIKAAQLIVLLGASPQTPWVGFAEFRVEQIFCEAELTLLLLFWKRRILWDQLRRHAQLIV
jgi:hypothetical protein